jgi:hypothetical protein
MPYYTRADLRQVPIFNEATQRVRAYHTKSAATVATIFLSHSHKDADVVNQAVELLGSQGVSIYVDWKDSSMPEVTSPETAKRIKAKIRECKKFVLLATDNALASTWVPWELGIGDTSNGMDNVAILPVTDPPHSWTGSEYVGIYLRIVKSDDGTPGVFEPGQTQGTSLATWLRK